MSEQLSLDLRVRDEHEFDGEICEIIIDTSQDRLSKGVIARSKHEAYGVIAENFSQIQNTIKSLKGDVGQLLAILPQDTTGSHVVNEISSIYGTSSKLAKESILLAALCKRIIEDIYNMDSEESSPFEEYAEMAKEAEFEDTDEIEESEEE